MPQLAQWCGILEPVNNLKLKSAGEYVEVAPGLALPQPMAVTAEDVRGFDVDVEAIVQHGRLVAREVCIRQREGGPPVTNEAIRSVPVAALLTTAATYVLEIERSGQLVTAADPYVLRTGPVWPSDELVKQVRELGPTAEVLRMVANLYRVALLTGQPPTVAVEKTLALPRWTAGRWIAAARDRGFLGPAEGPGKAGEAVRT